MGGSAQTTDKLQMVKDRLALTDEQIDSIRPILEEDLRQKNEVLLEYGSQLALIYEVKLNGLEGMLRRFQK